MMKLFQLSIVIFLIYRAYALNNGLALTPPMGWLQWERYACYTDCDNNPDNCIREELFMSVADHMVADGFRDAGYEYINIDDCWASKERDADGKLQPDPKRFPRGIKFLADYIHSKGLKLGIYGDIGTQTCGGYPGTMDHIQVDANTFAEWGVDMLKLDGCNADAQYYETGYTSMSMALNGTGRPIVFSCSWPDYIKLPNYTKIAAYCNLWRNYNDIQDSWTSVLGIIDHYGMYQDVFQPFAGPGHWNDPDMLIIGNFGLSLDQQKVQMALWAIFAAPLLMSTDLAALSKESKAILLNKEIIEVNQDPLGVQGRLIRSTMVEEGDNPGNFRVYSRPLMNGDVAVALLYVHSFGGPETMSFTFKEVGLGSGNVTVRDLFTFTDLGIFQDGYSTFVNPTGVKLYRLHPM